jgi:AraC-like DNA-binding protein
VHADDLLSERRTAAGLRGLVENQLLSMLPSGRVQTAAVAQQLGMSARSFKRHLAQEGTSFSEILDRLRNRLARRYLEDERISLCQYPVPERIEASVFIISAARRRKRFDILRKRSRPELLTAARVALRDHRTRAQGGHLD